jgi:O-acetyl-ADP-ribose deacetylase (regulator of RNase III)
MKNFAIKFPKTTSAQKAAEVSTILGIADLCLTSQDYVILFKKGGKYELFDNKTFPKDLDVVMHLCRNDRNISRNVIKDLDIWKAEKIAEYIPSTTPSCEYNEVKGDMLAMTKEGKFNVIGYGLNCHGRMTGGLSKQMVDTFGTDKFPMEDPSRKGDSTKLGEIDFSVVLDYSPKKLAVVNCYTQNWPGKHGNYKAVRSCLNKMNKAFHGLHIGILQIGCGVAGLDWNKVKEIILEEMVDCKVTVVIFEK